MPGCAATVQVARCPNVTNRPGRVPFHTRFGCKAAGSGGAVWNDGRVLSPDRAPATRPSTPMGRRAFLTVAGTATALTLTGCSLFGGGSPTTRTVVQTAPPPVDPMLTLLATTRLHLARLDAALTAVAADAATVALLTPLRADRAAHLAALEAEQDRGAGVTESESSSAAGAAPQVQMPTDVEAVKAIVRTDAETAQVQFNDGVVATGRYRAALFASIAACLASHRSVLV
jgi:hypothetical protein